MAISIGSLRERFQDWLTNPNLNQHYLLIDGWDLNLPSNQFKEINGKNYPTNSAIAQPVDEVEWDISRRTDINANNTEDIKIEAVFSFLIRYRFPSSYKYHQVPRKNGEIRLGRLYKEALLNYKNISEEILDLEIAESSFVTVSEAEKGKNSDWLLVLEPAFKVSFYLGIEREDVLQPEYDVPNVPFKELNVAVWRSYVDEVGNRDKSVKDYEFKVTNE